MIHLSGSRPQRGEPAAIDGDRHPSWDGHDKVRTGNLGPAGEEMEKPDHEEQGGLLPAQEHEGVRIRLNSNAWKINFSNKEKCKSIVI